MKKIIFALAIFLQASSLFSQEIYKKRISLNLVRHSSLISATYTQLFHPFENDNWQLGLGVGYGNGISLNGGSLAHNSIPFFGVIEYGKQHQVGYSLGYAYRFRFNQISNLGLTVDGSAVTVYTDYHVVTSSLYYRYSFGNEMRYFIGAGAEYLHPLGTTLGQEVEWSPQINPTLEFGIWL